MLPGTLSPTAQLLSTIYMALPIILKTLALLPAAASDNMNNRPGMSLISPTQSSFFNNDNTSSAMGSPRLFSHFSTYPKGEVVVTLNHGSSLLMIADTSMTSGSYGSPLCSVRGGSRQCLNSPFPPTHRGKNGPRVEKWSFGILCQNAFYAKMHEHVSILRK